MNPPSTTKQEFVAALGAFTGNLAVLQVKAGLKAIYLSGWQVAAEANLTGQMYRDQKFPCELTAMGDRLLFTPLAGCHALNYGMFRLAREFNKRGMPAYAELQEAEFAGESFGYSATRHQQREVGTGCFDDVSVIISGGESSTAALRGSTEAEQFHRQAIAETPGDLGKEGSNSQKTNNN